MPLTGIGMNRVIGGDQLGGIHEITGQPAARHGIGHAAVTARRAAAYTAGVAAATPRQLHWSGGRPAPLWLSGALAQGSAADRVLCRAPARRGVRNTDRAIRRPWPGGGCAGAGRLRPAALGAAAPPRPSDESLTARRAAAPGGPGYRPPAVPAVPLPGPAPARACPVDLDGWGGVDRRDHRMVIDAVFFRARVGCPWRDLPEGPVNWKTIYNRHRRWSLDGTWEKILGGLRAGCDEAEGKDWTVSADSTVIRAHQHAAGARHAPPAERVTGGTSK